MSEPVEPVAAAAAYHYAGGMHAAGKVLRRRPAAVRAALDIARDLGLYDWRAKRILSDDVVAAVADLERARRREGAPKAERPSVQRMVDEAPAPTVPNRQSVDVKATDDEMEIRTEGVTTLAELLEMADVSPDAWDVQQWKANAWTGQAAGGEIVQHTQVKANLIRRPDWWVPGVRAVAPLPRAAAASDDGGDVCLILPDSQHGFRFLDARRDTLIPTHDEAACAVALEAAHVLQPSHIVLLGDMLDLAEWSTKYARHPRDKYTTQPALEALHAWIAALRKTAPSARIVYLEGNHEDRMMRAMVERLEEVVDLRAVGDDTPLVSVPGLLGLDELDVEYVGPYGSDWWLWGVQYHHGAVVGGGRGGTVAKVLATATHSQVFGHVHRREVASRTISTQQGDRTVTAMSPGCLCRIDGVVPGRQGSPVTDWQHGMAVAYRDETLGAQLHLVPIDHGRAVVHGRAVRAA